MPNPAIHHDAIIVGGSFAGLSAALQLARALRQILVVDAGVRRNRFSAHSHGFLGQDGRAPAEIVSEAKAQLLAYPTVRWLQGKAMQAHKSGACFVVTDEAGARHEARRLLLATGVRDDLPDLPGLRERWGKTVLHCPYCHGYEIGGGSIGVLATGPLAAHQALLVADWGDVTLFCNRAFEPDEETRGQLARRGVRIEMTPVSAVEGDGEAIAGLRLSDDRLLAVKALFVASAVRPSSPLGRELGCVLEEMPYGQILHTDAWKQTSVPGVYAAGDTAMARQSVALAVADGALAGIGLHQSLIA